MIEEMKARLAPSVRQEMAAMIAGGEAGIFHDWLIDRGLVDTPAGLAALYAPHPGLGLRLCDGEDGRREVMDPWVGGAVLAQFLRDWGEEETAAAVEAITDGGLARPIMTPETWVRMAGWSWNVAPGDPWKYLRVSKRPGALPLVVECNCGNASRYRAERGAWPVLEALATAFHCQSLDLIVNLRTSHRTTLHVGQCQRCRTVYWTADPDDPLLWPDLRRQVLALPFFESITFTTEFRVSDQEIYQAKHPEGFANAWGRACFLKPWRSSAAVSSRHDEKNRCFRTRQVLRPLDFLPPPPESPRVRDVPWYNPGINFIGNREAIRDQILGGLAVPPELLKPEVVENTVRRIREGRPAGLLGRFWSYVFGGWRWLARSITRLCFTTSGRFSAGSKT